jgi:hypothetical protein
MDGFGLSRPGDPEKKRWSYMKAKDFDTKFDSGEDVTQFLDLSKARRPKQEQKRVNVGVRQQIVVDQLADFLHLKDGANRCRVVL